MESAVEDEAESDVFADVEIGFVSNPAEEDRIEQSYDERADKQIGAFLFRKQEADDEKGEYQHGDGDGDGIGNIEIIVRIGEREEEFGIAAAEGDYYIYHGEEDADDDRRAGVIEFRRDILGRIFIEIILFSVCEKSHFLLLVFLMFFAEGVDGRNIRLFVDEEGKTVSRVFDC